MGGCASISANILLGGNDGFAARWVSGRCVGRAGQNFLGSDRPAGRFRGADVAVHSPPGDGSHGFAAAAAHFFQSTHFYGFQLVAWFIVARPPSHSMDQAADFCRFQVPCRLTVSYPPASHRAIVQGWPASIAAPDRARGVPPFATSRARDARRGCGGTRFQKRAETGQSLLPRCSGLADGRTS